MSDIDPRPFYFSQIRIDPANDQRVYVLGFGCCLFPMMAARISAKIFRRKFIPIVTRSRFNRNSAPPPKPPKPEDKNKPAEAAGLSARDCSEPMVAFIKVTAAEKAGNI